MSVSIERFACSVDDPCAVAAFAPVCGGRRFRRHFNKRDFPVLGDDYEDSIDRFVQIIELIWCSDFGLTRAGLTTMAFSPETLCIRL